MNIIKCNIKSIVSYFDFIILQLQKKTQSENKILEITFTNIKLKIEF